MTSRITISVAHDAPHHVVIKGGPAASTLKLKPGDSQVIDLIDGYQYSIEQGAKHTATAPEPEANIGAPTLWAGLA